MIVDAAYTYMANKRMHRKRTFAWQEYRGSVPVEIREVSASEAPTAMWWPTPTMDKTKVALRAIGDALYEPQFLGSGKMDRPGPDKAGHARKNAPRLMGLDDLLEMFTHRISGQPEKIDWATIPDKIVRIDQDESVAEVSESSKAKIEGDIQKLASMLVSVDGVIYRRVETPVYVVEHDIGFQDSTIRTRYGQARISAEAHPIFSPNEFKDAWKLYEGLPHRYGLMDTRQSWAPEIMLPEALSTDTFRMMLTSAQSEIISKMQQDVSGRNWGQEPQITRMPKAAMSSYVAMRDDPGQTDLQVLHDRLTDFVAVAPEIGTLRERVTDVLDRVRAARLVSFDGVSEEAALDIGM